MIVKTFREYVKLYCLKVHQGRVLIQDGTKRRWVSHIIFEHVVTLWETSVVPYGLQWLEVEDYQARRGLSSEQRQILQDYELSHVIAERAHRYRQEEEKWARKSRSRSTAKSARRRKS